MKLRNARMEHSPQIMIIPMIDIIFFLLVFFMMSTLYMTNQQSIPVNLPVAASAQQDIVKSFQVTVAKDGALYLGTDRMDLAALKQHLQEESRSAEVAVALRAMRTWTTAISSKSWMSSRPPASRASVWRPRNDE